MLKQGGSEIAQSPMLQDERQGVISIEGSHSEFGGYMATIPQGLPPFGGAPGFDAQGVAVAGFYNQGQKSSQQYES